MSCLYAIVSSYGEEHVVGPFTSLADAVSYCHRHDYDEDHDITPMNLPEPFESDEPPPPLTDDQLDQIAARVQSYSGPSA